MKPETRGVGTELEAAQHVSATEIRWDATGFGLKSSKGEE
jgi:hypothetical protein